MHKTVARARFHIKAANKCTRSELFFWHGRVCKAKCAGDCRESSVSHKKFKTEGFRALLEDEVGKFH